jgi:hypothetical protein
MLGSEIASTFRSFERSPARSAGGSRIQTAPSQLVSSSTRSQHGNSNSVPTLRSK